MRHPRAVLAVAFATLIVSISIAQQSSVGGTPSRPIFQKLTVNRSGTYPLMVVDSDLDDSVTTFGTGGSGQLKICVTNGNGDGMCPSLPASSAMLVTSNQPLYMSNNGGTSFVAIPRSSYGVGLAAGGLSGGSQWNNISSIVRNSLGNYTANFAYAYTTLPPVCNVTASNVHALVVSITTSAMTYRTLDSSNTDADVNAFVHCVGT